MASLNSDRKVTANTVTMDMAPSVDEADEILARFGYVERPVALAA